MPAIANTPEPPYYAVIFTSLHSDSTDGYQTSARRMLDLAKQQPGFLGVESARDEAGITVSYWRDLASIKNWKNVAEHREAQALGQKKWYRHYAVRIAKVERDYSFQAPEQPIAATPPNQSV